MHVCAGEKKCLKSLGYEADKVAPILTARVHAEMHTIVDYYMRV